jgi:2-dehydropantoate 2-reductase
MRIAVFGTGGVGGYFGGRLAEAGEDVTFIARGEHLAVIREQGLRVDSPEGDFLIRPARATDDPGEVGPVDAVLVAVKAWQLPEAATAMKALVDPTTFVVPLLNGVEAPDVLAAELGREHVLGGLCRIFSHIEGPGHIAHTGFPPTVDIGELDGGRSERVRRLADALGRCKGVIPTVHDDIVAAMWMKFAFIAPASGVASVARAPYGVIRSVPQTRAVLEEAIAEVEAVGRARGVSLPDDLVLRIMAIFDALAPNEVPSMQRDLLAGRPSELEAQNGAVVRLGAEAGVPTPVHRFLYAALLPQERASRGEV